MNEDVGSLALVAIVALLMASGLGFAVGRWTGRGVVSPPSAEAADTVKPSPVPLRCGVDRKTGESIPWSQVDAEAAVHRAQVALDTALGSAWVEKRMTNWTSFGQATLDLIRVCWEAK